MWRTIFSNKLVTVKKQWTAGSRWCTMKRFVINITQSSTLSHICSWNKNTAPNTINQHTEKVGLGFFYGWVNRFFCDRHYFSPVVNQQETLYSKQICVICTASGKNWCTAFVLQKKVTCYEKGIRKQLHESGVKTSGKKLRNTT